MSRKNIKLHNRKKSKAMRTLRNNDNILFANSLKQNYKVTNKELFCIIDELNEDVVKSLEVNSLVVSSSFSEYKNILSELSKFQRENKKINDKKSNQKNDKKDNKKNDENNDNKSDDEKLNSLGGAKEVLFCKTNMLEKEMNSRSIQNRNMYMRRKKLNGNNRLLVQRNMIKELNEYGMSLSHENNFDLLSNKMKKQGAKIEKSKNILQTDCTALDDDSK